MLLLHEELINDLLVVDGCCSFINFVSVVIDAQLMSPSEAVCPGTLIKFICQQNGMYSFNSVLGRVGDGESGIAA